jgi:hypothetical protein
MAFFNRVPLLVMKIKCTDDVSKDLFYNDNEYLLRNVVNSLIEFLFSNWFCIDKYFQDTDLHYVHKNI